MDKKIPKILAVIPARGGSKGVVGKNIKPIAKKPLLAYTIEEAKKSKYIDRLVVSTEDEKIASVAKDFAAEVIRRPKELAQDDTPTPPVLLQVVNFLAQKENYFPDLVLLLSPTCPLRKAKHIDELIEKFLAKDYDCMISVIFIYKHRYEITADDILLPVVADRPNRQQRKPVVLENGVIYLSTIDLIKQEKAVSGKIGYYLMDDESSINIDEPIDFVIAEQLILNKK